MKAETIARLTAESEAPSGVAVRIDSAEMAALLRERSLALGIIDLMLASANPNPDDHPAMCRAWGAARAALEQMESE